MNFTKVVLSLVMMSLVVQASNRELTNVSSQGVQIESKKKDRRGCCCSCIKTAAITIATLSVALAGWNAYENQVLLEDVQNLPNKVNECVAACDKPDAACYDACAQRVFSGQRAGSLGDLAAAEYRDKLRYRYGVCIKSWRKKSDIEAVFTSKECVEKVLDIVKKDEKHDGSYELPEDAQWRPVGIFEGIGAIFMLARIAAGAL